MPMGVLLRFAGDESICGVITRASRAVKENLVRRNPLRPRPIGALLTGALGAVALLAGCGGPAASQEATVDIWVHSGSDTERATITAQVHDFNVAARGRVTARLRVVAEGDYSDVLQAAAAAGTLPDVVEIDGPMLASLHYQGVLADLATLIPAPTIRALLPSLVAQGTVEGVFVGAGSFDSGLGIFGNRHLLDAAGVDYPRGVEDGWTAAQFTQALGSLSAQDPDRLVLDLKRNYGTGEWLTYGFAPLLWSAGGDLVDRATGAASGVLDGPDSVRAMVQLGAWAGFVDPNADDQAFASGRVALSWVGHWAYPDYAAALASDLVVLPLPDLGLGGKTGLGSWTWSVTTSAVDPDAAGEFVAYLLSATQVARISAANGAVPGRTDVLASSVLYGRGGALERFGRQLDKTCGPGRLTTACVAVERPVTPGYPTITANAARAIDAVLNGSDAQAVLTEAALAIDADLDANGGYQRDQ